MAMDSGDKIRAHIQQLAGIMTEWGEFGPAAIDGFLQAELANAETAVRAMNDRVNRSGGKDVSDRKALWDVFEKYLDVHLAVAFFQSIVKIAAARSGHKVPGFEVEILPTGAPPK